MEMDPRAQFRRIVQLPHFILELPIFFQQRQRLLLNIKKLSLEFRQLGANLHGELRIVGISREISESFDARERGYERSGIKHVLHSTRVCICLHGAC